MGPEDKGVLVPYFCLGPTCTGALGFLTAQRSFWMLVGTVPSGAQGP